jgi:hypothetical protein
MSDALDFDFKCGSEIIDKCKNLGIPWGEDWSFQMLMNDLVDASQVLLKYGIQYVVSDMTENMVKGINALRCMLSSISDSGWNLIASAYWFIVTLGLEEAIKPKLD